VALTANPGEFFHHILGVSPTLLTRRQGEVYYIGQFFELIFRSFASYNMDTGPRTINMHDKAQEFAAIGGGLGSYTVTECAPAFGEGVVDGARPACVILFLD
jgi:hypothetical protein